MSGARALVAAVPQRVWTAVAGLVLLGSVGVALVLGAGLSTWQGGVTHVPTQGAAQPPLTVVLPPGSAVIVVPTPRGPVAQVPVPARGRTAATGGPVGVPLPAPAPAAVATPAGAAAPVPAATATTARPRTAATATALPHTGPGRSEGKAKLTGTRHPAAHRHHGNHGKHLGWTKGMHTGAASGHGRSG